jgi:hypothetical protein
VFTHKWLVPLFLVMGGWFVVTNLIGADAKVPMANKDLDLLRVDLPDGTTWTLGDKGVGRPFMASLLLCNKGKAAIRIWDPTNSEGSACPRITLTDATGKETVLQKAPIERSAGAPTIWTIEPNQVIKIDLELLRLIGEHSLPAGTYKLRAFYQNTLADSDPIKGVWTGQIASPVQEIKIVAPGK